MTDGNSPEGSTKKSTISIDIQLDATNMPEKISWASTDGNRPPQECGSFMLSIWDRKADETLRIDLWDKDMRKDEMDKFFFQTLITMSDTYLRSNGDEKMAALLRDFGYQFGEKAQLVRRKTEDEIAAEEGTNQGSNSNSGQLDLTQLAEKRQKPEE